MERCTSRLRSARPLAPTPLPEGRGDHLTVPNENPSPSGRRWRQPDEGSAGAMHITLALRPYPHPNPSLPRGGHRDVPGFPRSSKPGTSLCPLRVEERGRWRQPDEGAGGAVHITLALRPHPHPNPSPGGRGALRRATHGRYGCSSTFKVDPSPSGRRWRQPDEGAGGAVRITLALHLHLRPNPSPNRRGAIQ